MRWNFLREVVRKGVHLLILVVIICYSVILHIYGKEVALLSLVGLFLTILLLEYLRLDLEFRFRWLDFLIRPKEISQMHGAIYMMAATVICFAVFDFRIALAALLMTAFGDMTAAIVGQRYGRFPIFRKKTLIGGVSELGVNVLIGFIALFSVASFYTIFAMAIAATLVEVFVESVDDNLVVPVVAGFIGQLLVLL